LLVVGGLVLFFGAFAAVFSPVFFLGSLIASAAEWWRHRTHRDCDVTQLAAIVASASAFVLILVVCLIAGGRFG
jgi:hypothetical protein